MNKNKHTPGPWHYTNQIIFKDGICIAETFSRETGMDAVANAQLIAAAPDLLAALKDLQKAVREHGLLDIKKRFSLCNADAQANAVITKAKKGT